MLQSTAAIANCVERLRQLASDDDESHKQCNGDPYVLELAEPSHEAVDAAVAAPLHLVPHGLEVVPVDVVDVHDHSLAEAGEALRDLLVGGEEVLHDP